VSINIPENPQIHRFFFSLSTPSTYSVILEGMLLRISRGGGYCVLVEEGRHGGWLDGWDSAFTFVIWMWNGG
jgi:hypothetical protein